MTEPKRGRPTMAPGKLSKARAALKRLRRRYASDAATARALKVSQATVFRILSGGGTTEETAEKIERLDALEQAQEAR